MQIQLGARVRRNIEALTYKEGKKLKHVADNGEVIYIHPKGRFYTVRFDCGFCESYFARA